jgi:hypothetical protein
MMAVDVSTNPVFKLGVPKPLFVASILGGATARHVIRYDVAADGSRFLINAVPPEARTLPEAPITVVLNWTTLLKR